MKLVEVLQATREGGVCDVIAVFETKGAAQQCIKSLTQLKSNRNVEYRVLTLPLRHDWKENWFEGSLD